MRRERRRDGGKVDEGNKIEDVKRRRSGRDGEKVDGGIKWEVRRERRRRDGEKRGGEMERKWMEEKVYVEIRRASVSYPLHVSLYIFFYLSSH